MSKIKPSWFKHRVFRCRLLCSEPLRWQWRIYHCWRVLRGTAGPARKSYSRSGLLVWRRFLVGCRANWPTKLSDANRFRLTGSIEPLRPFLWRGAAEPQWLGFGRRGAFWACFRLGSRSCQDLINRPVGTAGPATGALDSLSQKGILIQIVFGGKKNNGYLVVCVFYSFVDELIYLFFGWLGGKP